MGDPTGSTGLKGQWGVGNPASPTSPSTPTTTDTGSDKQAQDFQAAFQQQQGVINGHLQYTSANAEAARHDPLAARRDALYAAFQSALGKIDRNNPAKAQGDIDKVLGDASALAGEVGTFRQQAEKAKNDWDSRQGSFDETVHKVEELEAWEDAKAPALRGLVDGIRNYVNQRQYAQASTTLDQLLPKLAPIYEEYLRQKEAKPQYEQQLAEQTARLDPLKAADRPSQPMTAKAGEADSAMQQAKGKADSKDFVAGLEQMHTVQAAIDELDQMANDPERAKFLADIGGVEQIVQPLAGTAFHSQEADWSAITALKDQVAPAGDGGDYAGANGMLADLKDKVDAFKAKHDELEQQKQAYEDALTQAQPRLQAVSVSEPQYAKLQPMQQELDAVRTQMEASAQAEDFGQALTQVQDLSSKLDALEQAKTEIDQKRQEYEAALAALQPRIDAVSVSDPAYAKLEPMLAEISAARQAMETAAQAGDYDQALTLAQDLTAKLDAYEQAKAEIDAKKQEYEAALAALQPRLDAVSVSDPAYAKIEPQLQEITQARTTMEASAQAGDYDQANAQLQDLTAKVDAYEQAKTEIDQKKQEYETALAALQPRLDAVSVSDPAYAKIEPQLQEITQARTTMEASAQTGDYDQANTQLQDLTTKVDVYEKAKTEIDQAKQAYETTLAALQPRLTAVSVSDPAYVKIEPQLQEIAQAQTTMEASAQTGDYEQANAQLQDLTTKVDAYEKAKAEIDQQKQAYETLRSTVEPRITEASKKQYLNLAPKLEEIKKLQAQAVTAAQAGDYAAATQHMNDASAKTDAYVTACDKEVEPPILGDTQNARADAVMKKLPEADQKEIKALMDSAKSEAEKQYLLKGVAAGHTVAELKEFAKKIEGKDEKWMRDHLSVTGSSSGTGIKQQWSHSCNATTAEAVKAQMDPVYALKLHDDNPELDQADNADGTKKNPSLAADQKADLQSGYTGARGNMGGGVAVSRDGSGGAGRWNDDLLNKDSDTTGITYTPENVTGAAAVKKIDSGVSKGQPVPLVIGDPSNPKTTYAHYVLVTGMTNGPPKQYTIHDPWSGQTVVRSEADLTGGKVNLAGWNQITALEGPAIKEVKK